MIPGITVVIPTIPVRMFMLNRAIMSVVRQTAHDYMPVRMEIETDEGRTGAAATRQRALQRVRTEWTAFLDDDDELKADHLMWCWRRAFMMNEDYVYPWYDVAGGVDPRPEVFGQPFDPANPVQTTITTLVRTELAQAVGFRDVEPGSLASPDRHYAGEDWAFTQGCLAAGARIGHLAERTWVWHHHGGNTSGLAKNW